MITGVFFLSLVSIFGRLLASTSGYTNTFFGYCVVLILTTLWLIARGELKSIFLRSKRIDILLLGLGQLGSAAFFLQAVRSVDLATAGLLLYSAPLWIVLISIMAKTEQITRKIILPLILGFVGVVLVLAPQLTGQSFDIRFGLLLGLLSGISYAVSYIFARRIGDRMNTAVIVFWAHAIGVVLLLPVLFLYPLPLHTSSLWLLGIGLSWTFGYFFLYYALRFIQAHYASMIALFEPVFIAIWGAVFFGESLTITSVIGGVLILTNVYFINKATK